MNIRYYRAQRELDESGDIMTDEHKEAFLKLCHAIVRIRNGVIDDILEAFKKLPHQCDDRCITDMIHLNNSLTSLISIDDSEFSREIHPIESNRSF
jgi:hypothetical protein